MTNSIRQTPLHQLHIELGAKLVDFAGWHLPINYAPGIMEEHKHCRSKAALFDVSHMGQVTLKGEQAARQLESLVPAALTELPEGKARYTFFTNDKGGIMDDLIVSNAGDHLFVVVNASMRDQDIAHMKKHLDGVEVTEITDRALVAVQGPAAESVVAALCPAAAELTFMQTMTADLMGVNCRVSRLGYTGEDGFEISIPESDAIKITRALLEHDDCQPAGLGARDSLRMEAGLCLYGNDIDQNTTPVEASLLWAIQKRRREEGGFPGVDKILAQIENGCERKLVGIRPAGRAPARQGAELQSVDGKAIGMVTSGGYGPSVGAPIAMGYIDSRHAETGVEVKILVRGKLLDAVVAKLPFVTQNYKR